MLIGRPPTFTWGTVTPSQPRSRDTLSLWLSGCVTVNQYLALSTTYFLSRKM